MIEMALCSNDNCGQMKILKEWLKITEKNDQPSENMHNHCNRSTILTGKNTQIHKSHSYETTKTKKNNLKIRENCSDCKI